LLQSESMYLVPSLNIIFLFLSILKYTFYYNAHCIGVIYLFNIYVHGNYGNVIICRISRSSILELKIFVDIPIQYAVTNSTNKNYKYNNRLLYLWFMTIIYYRVY